MDFEFGFGSMDGNELPLEISKYGAQLNNYLKSNHKVACFVTDNQEATIASDSPSTYLPERGFARPRMWAQYADNHSGLVLVFNKSKLERSILSQFSDVFLGPIEYMNDINSLSRDNPFIIDFDKLSRIGTDKYFKEHIVKHNKAIFFRKSKDWAQEREWRFVLQEKNPGDQFFEIGASLEGVALGWKMNDQTTSQIKLSPFVKGLDIAQLHWHNGFPQPLPVNMWAK